MGTKSLTIRESSLNDRTEKTFSKASRGNNEKMSFLISGPTVIVVIVLFQLWGHGLSGATGRWGKLVGGPGSQFLYESFPLLVKQPMQDCSSNQFTCDDGSLCIDQEWKCDEEKDCEDGSDEKDCPVCNELTCDNGNCVDLYFKCDGDDDCEDGTDEKDCPGPIEETTDNGGVSPTQDKNCKWQGTAPWCYGTRCPRGTYKEDSASYKKDSKYPGFGSKCEFLGVTSGEKYYCCPIKKSGNKQIDQIHRVQV